VCGGSSFESSEFNKYASVKFLCMTPVGDISRPEALEDQSIVFDVYIESVVY
jgi:hypothetical protein